MTAESAPRPRRSPLRVALYTFAAVIVVGIVAGAVAFTVNPGGDAEARGEKFGRGLALFATFCAAISYWRQSRRKS